MPDGRFIGATKRRIFAEHATEKERPIVEALDIEIKQLELRLSLLKDRRFTAMYRVYDRIRKRQANGKMVKNKSNSTQRTSVERKGSERGNSAQHAGQ